MFMLKIFPRTAISKPSILKRRTTFIVIGLWIFILIVLTYKLTNGYDNESTNFPATTENLHSSHLHDQVRRNNVKFGRVAAGVPISDRFIKENDVIEVVHKDDNDVIQHLIKSGSSETTNSWDTKNNVRQAKVFILLIEEERLRSFKSSARNKAKDLRRQVRPDLDSDLPNQDWDITLPDHIALVIDILESHRIGYTLGTTRNGLPSSLLADTKEETSKEPQYSVIIIDNFMRYTKLNRWIRDQIDRHCRKNQIGIVTFLTSPPIISLSSHSRTSRSTSSSSYSQLPSTTASVNILDQFESVPDQFPFTYQPIHQNICNKKPPYSRNDRNPASCLTDYQLNDRSAILRILKRRPNFILRGPLIRNLGDSSWISMTTNHVTYEPLTWATLIQADNTQFPNNVTRSMMMNDSRINNNNNENLTELREKQHQQRHRRAAIDNLASYSKLSAESSAKKSMVANGNDKVIEGEGGSARMDLTRINSSVSFDGLDRKDSMRMIDGNLTNEVMLDQNDQQKGDESAPESPFDYETLNGQPIGNNQQQQDDQLDNDSDLQPNLIDQKPVSDDKSFDSFVDRQILSLYDRGLFDGIKRVIFGGANHHWLNRVLLLDAIEHLSKGRILTPLDRYIQIDIDDVFVGERGTKLEVDDVDALLATQALFSQRLPGFKFNLGYSGAFFGRGLEAEVAGDKRLVEVAPNFTWFCHTWSHKKLHLLNDTESIELELRKNVEFAQVHGLPLIGKNNNNSDNDKTGNQLDGPEARPSYAVAPHHSGVYPIHDQLYEAWKSVLNVQVTSTEEYPHLRPASRRRGFVHKSIKVLPRQTCGLYTHTIMKSKYPGGLRRLIATIEGGDLFQTILHNLVNIYMTHQSNYGHDRLAPHTFERLFRFVDNHTNLRLKFAPSTEAGPSSVSLADYYFKLYPNEMQEPLWTNPCSDQRHSAIWAPQKQYLCKFTPKLFIVGPQKSGTTALLEFLQLSPNIQTSQLSPTDFEEVQFFNEKHYWRGVDWYLNRFSDTNNKTLRSQDSFDKLEQSILYVDKSATYFDDPKVPQRAHTLSPDAQIIIMLINPADRAYSWYHHQRAHNDPIANQYSFEEVIQSLDDDQQSEDSSQLKQLRSRCLAPGFYSSHLSRWLDFYSSRQIIIIDGQWFRTNPAAVLNRLQVLLRLDSQLDYRDLLIHDPKKGFFCQKINPGIEPKSKCLGPGKGRHYEPMSADARLYLNRFYYNHNCQLARILNDIGQPLPIWLLEATASSSVSYNYLKR